MSVRGDIQALEPEGMHTLRTRTKGQQMERHEIKSRVDAKLDAQKRDLDAMRVKVDASEGDEQAAYREHVTALGKQHEELRIRAAEAWQSADDGDPEWDTVVDDIEKTLDEWTKGAARTRDDVLKSDH
jgi:nucleotide-binding universal stress UspA family protein